MIEVEGGGGCGTVEALARSTVCLTDWGDAETSSLGDVSSATVAESVEAVFVSPSTCLMDGVDVFRDHHLLCRGVGGGTEAADCGVSST